MKITGNICVSGGKKMADGRFVNEDGLVTFSVDFMNKKYDFIILMDGATGLGKDHQIVEGYTSAEWYVAFMMREMKKMFEKEPSLDLEFVVEKCILKAIKEIMAFERENNINLEEYQKPSAALSLLRTDGKTTDVYLIGDTQAIVAYVNGEVTKIDNPNQTALQKLDNSVIRRMAELAKERGCNVLDTRVDEEIEKMLRDNRNKKNTDCEGCYWVCGTTPGTAKHGVCTTFNNSDVAGFVLASDGFDFSMLNLDEQQVYKFITESGTEVVTRLIREKQEEDFMCNQFPRFKKSDDLTVVYFDYMEHEKFIDFER